MAVIINWCDVTSVQHEATVGERAGRPETYPEHPLVVMLEQGGTGICSFEMIFEVTFELDVSL